MAQALAFAMFCWPMESFCFHLATMDSCQADLGVAPPLSLSDRGRTRRDRTRYLVPTRPAASPVRAAPGSRAAAPGSRDAAAAVDL